MYMSDMQIVHHFLTIFTHAKEVKKTDVFIVY